MTGAPDPCQALGAKGSAGRPDAGTFVEGGRAPPSTWPADKAGDDDRSRLEHRPLPEWRAEGPWAPPGTRCTVSASNAVVGEREGTADVLAVPYREPMARTRSARPCYGMGADRAFLRDGRGSPTSVSATT